VMRRLEESRNPRGRAETAPKPGPVTRRALTGGSSASGSLRRGLFAAILAVFVAACGSGGDGGVDNTSRTLSDIAFGAATFVTVGKNGRILTSSDGKTFTENASGVTETLNGVVFGADGVFVVAGDGGVVLTSTDGVTWVRESIATAASLQGVAFGNGTFVVVGYQGTIATSADGHTWVLQESGSMQALHRAVFGDGLFVAVGDEGIVLASADAVVWSEESSGTSDTLYAVSYGAGVYVLAGNGTVGHSTDGRSWVTRPEPSLFINDVAFAQDQFVLVGLGGTILTSSDGGVSLTPRDSLTSLGLRGIEFGADTFVAVGSGGVVRVSPDAVTWSQP